MFFNKGARGGFSKNVFNFHDFIDSLLLNVISRLPTTGSLLHQKKLYFLGRILTLPKVLKVVLDTVFKLRLDMLNVDRDSKLTGFLGESLRLLETYLMRLCHPWQKISIFPSYGKRKQIVNSRILKHERAYFLTASEEKPVVKFALTAFANIHPQATGHLLGTTLICCLKSEIRYVS